MKKILSEQKLVSRVLLNENEEFLFLNVKTMTGMKIVLIDIYIDTFTYIFIGWFFKHCPFSSLK